MDVLSSKITTCRLTCAVKSERNTYRCTNTYSTPLYPHNTVLWSVGCTVDKCFLLLFQLLMFFCQLIDLVSNSHFVWLEQLCKYCFGHVLTLFQHPSWQCVYPQIEAFRLHCNHDNSYQLLIITAIDHRCSFWNFENPQLFEEVY